MADSPALRKIEPYFIGQVVGYVEPQAENDICMSEGQWFVVQAEPKQEKFAKEALGNAGFVVYLPIEPCRQRHGLGRFRTASKSMFGPYLFCKAPPDPVAFAKICTTTGVRRLLSTNGRPRPVNPGLIEVVRLAEADLLERSNIPENQLKWHFRPKDRIRISSGPFSGFYATCSTAVDEHEKIRVLFQYLGRSTRLELHASQVEAI